MRLAVTGGTGFVGQRLLRLAVAAGHGINALARSAQPDMGGIIWVSGDLMAPAIPDDLCRGADVVIHVGGVINPRRSSDFFSANVDGTERVLQAAIQAGVRRFIHVSSLAAREPDLSRYGTSKAASEALFPKADLDWTIVRPPAVYGPADRETLELFRMAKRGISLVPHHGSASYIHVDDLCAALLSLAIGSAGVGQTFEPDDGHPGGYTHPDFARRIGLAVGRDQIVVPVPDIGLRIAAALNTAAAAFTQTPPKLSLDRARYFAHPDWVSRGPEIPGWSPTIDAAIGLAATTRWYREAGWL